MTQLSIEKFMKMQLNIDRQVNKQTPF